MNDKAEAALNEARILVLVAQVLLGFAYQATFQQGFASLPRHAQWIAIGSLGCLLVALALLLAPSAYHRIVSQGQINAPFLQFITRVTTPALLPFAIGIGGNMLVAGEKIVSPRFGLACGVVSVSIALFFWYGLEAWVRRQEAHERGEGQPPSMHEGADSMPTEPTPLKDKIKFVLTEVRVVLPGAQALLGFQFAAILTEGFDRLSPLSKDMHLCSLACIALSAILLMAPAAYHRLVERGNDTERLHRFASRTLLWAMLLLALGIAGDVWVVVVKVFHSTRAATMVSISTLLLIYGLWFGYMFFQRAEKPYLNTLSAQI